MGGAHKRQDLTFEASKYLALKITNFQCSFFLLALNRPLFKSIISFIRELRKALERLESKRCLCVTGDITIDTLALFKNDAVDHSATREKHLLYRFVSSCIDDLKISASAALMRSAVIGQKLVEHFFVFGFVPLGSVCRNPPNHEEQSA